MNIKTAWGFWTSEEHGVSEFDGATEKCFLDLDERVVDLDERHDTWVRKRSLMLDVAKNERTMLREQVEALEIGAQWAKDEIGNLLKNTPSKHEYEKLRERVAKQDNTWGAMSEALARVNLEIVTLRERAKRANEVSDQAIAKLREQVDKAAAEVAEISKIARVEAQRVVELRYRVAVLETCHNITHDPPHHECEPHTCETCEHYKKVQGSCFGHCVKIGTWPDHDDENCEWKPRAEQPDRQAEARALDDITAWLARGDDR